MEPQVGNKIRIKHNLLIGRYGTNSVVEEMQRYRGQIATIENSVNVEREIEGQRLKGIEYIIDLDNGYYSWTKDMFSMEIKDEDLFNVIEETIGVNMFTGIVEEIGEIKSIKKGSKSEVLYIKGKEVLKNTKVGDSIAVNGVCLTVTSMDKDTFTADVIFDNSSIS